MSDTITEGIRIRAEPQYLAERSQPAAGEYVFAYQITISNVGDAPAKLVSRHWVVSDSTGEEQHVRGAGVVGEQPRLAPGQEFQYVSYCPLPTAVGAMHGEFQMVRDDGAAFDARIEPFTLAAPHTLN
jgi:ApaG protein